jgi:DNA repair protein RadC
MPSNNAKGANRSKDMHEVRSQDAAPYTVTASTEDSIIEQAMAILANRMKEQGQAFHGPNDICKYLAMHAAKRVDQYKEVFAVVFLDSQNRMIAVDDMFHGTLTQTSVYPREVVRAALAHNAAAVVLTHNHPSGDIKPSRADETLTQTLKAALALVDVRVLDHIITGDGGKTLSMAMHGLV